jgi:hypothetical protein
VLMLTRTETKPPGHRTLREDDYGCGCVAEFSRLRYFHGQPLSALDLRREQAYHLDKARLRNRLLHGWGIVCGLDLRVAVKQDCRPEENDPTATEVIVVPGSAIDCAGNEIVVRHPRPVYVSDLLKSDDLERLHKKPGTVYLTLCYAEVLADPSRPLLAHGCEPPPSCEYARTIETYQICVSTVRPDGGPHCEPCCGACGDPCLELAAIHNFDPAAPVTQAQIDLSGRRRLALHPFAQVTEINWVHGGTYPPADADGLLDDGIEVWFSRPIRTDTLQQGVVDLTWVALGRGVAGSVFTIEGEFKDLPQTEYTDHFVYRRTTGERLNEADRVIITVRGDFILDECCRAVDGNHVGGGVPVSGSAAYKPQSAPKRSCAARPSGDGVEGGDFVSWIYVAKGSEK